MPTSRRGSARSSPSAPRARQEQPEQRGGEHEPGGQQRADGRALVVGELAEDSHRAERGGGGEAEEGAGGGHAADPAREHRLEATQIHNAEFSRVAYECSTSAACACCTSCTRAARSPRWPTRCSSRRRPSPSSSRCSSARPGWPLLEPAGRGVRLTDAALVLVRHAEALLERAELAEAELAAAAGSVAGRGRIASFQSVALRLAVPAMQALAREAPGLRCELIEAEPEQSLPALALGDVDLVLADEWQHQPLARPAGVDREDLRRDPVHLVLPERPPGRAAPPPRGAAGRARRRGLDDRPSRDRLGGDDRADLPRARRASTPTSATGPTTASRAWRSSRAGRP